MTDPASLVLMWTAGTVVAAVILGATAFLDDDDHPTAWFLAALWPFVLATLIVVACISIPFWIGQQIRKIFTRMVLYLSFEKI